MKYGKHLVSTIGNDLLNAYFRHFAGHLTCNYNFHVYKKRPRKLKSTNIYPHVFETKTQKFGDVKIFYFTVYIFLALKLSDVVFMLLINVKMPTIVGILTCMSRINFMLA